jgi:hypothetical protein
MAQSHFKKKPEGEKLKVKILVGWTESDAAELKKKAQHRKLDVNEYIRRCALGRKADVDYDTDIVLSLSGITHAIRAMHAGMVERNIAPPEAEMLSLILDARAAIQRISK